MIKEFELTLSATYSSGDPLTGEDFAKAISADVLNLTVAGDGAGAGDARIIGGIVLYKNFKKQGEEAHELCANAVRETCRDFGKWLGKLAPSGFDRLRAKGAEIDLIISCWMDKNQFDLELPRELTAQMARLGVPIKLTTDG